MKKYLPILILTVAGILVGGCSRDAAEKNTLAPSPASEAVPVGFEDADQTCTELAQTQSEEDFEDIYAECMEEEGFTVGPEQEHESDIYDEEPTTGMDPTEEEPEEFPEEEGDDLSEESEVSEKADRGMPSPFE